MNKLFAVCALALLSASTQAEQAAAWPSDIAKSGRVAIYTNPLGMKFVEIPAGSYLMGSAENGADRREKPQHRETIAQSFYIGIYEVTQGDWEKLMGENPYARDRSNPYYTLPGMAARITRPNHPATVSWNDAQKFIRKLNASDQAHHYRLPSEAEWEYVARAGTSTRYFFGDSVHDLGEYAWFGGNFATGGTHPVGSKKPNPWGLYDIYGNAWEWVEDGYRPTYDSPPTTDKTVRGGSWHSTADGWHSAWRKPYSTDYRGISIGFRLVMEKK